MMSLRVTLPYLLTAVVVALVVSVTVRLAAESMSGQTNELERLRGEHRAMALRLERLETKQHPSTARRFTMDHGLQMARCLDNPPEKQRACAKQFQLDNR